jgi:hypothetical protein
MARLAANCIVIFSIATALWAQPQISGGTCSNSTFNGPYFWLVSGAVVRAGVVVPGGGLARMRELLIPPCRMARPRAKAETTLPPSLFNMIVRTSGCWRIKASKRSASPSSMSPVPNISVGSTSHATGAE